jgi:hypothetical protein
MKNRSTPLMAIAMAGIAAPVAKATTFVETTDFSNSGSSPTNLGTFNPASDLIVGSMPPSDSIDAILVSGTPNAPISIPFNVANPNLSGAFLDFAIYDDAGPSGAIASRFFGGGPLNSNDVFNFNVPADGNYMMYLTTEGGGWSYTIGTAIPEPSTALLLTGAIGLAALLRKRKPSTPKS